MYDRFGWFEALLGMSVTGLAIGLGQALASEEKLTRRIIFGRALSSMGLGLIAGLVFLQIPDAPLPVIIGFSALSASLGTSGIEIFLHRFFNINLRKDK